MASRKPAARKTAVGSRSAPAKKKTVAAGPPVKAKTAKAKPAQRKTGKAAVGTRKIAASAPASATSGSRRATAKSANRRDNSARKRKKKVADRPVLAFVGEAARWTISPLWSPAFHAAVRRIVGAAMLPLGWISFETFLRSFGHAALSGAFWKTSELWFFGIGSIMWLVLFFGLRGRPMLWLYVAGHELTHAFFVLLSGGNVKKVHVSAEGGHVLTNKSNLIIVLSPYFVPFYTLVMIALWAITVKLVPEWTAARPQLLYALIGFTWCFHVSFTAWMITREQPDLHHYGRLFSIALIILVNLALISGLLIAASPDVTLADFTRAWWTNCTSFGSRLSESLREMVGVLR